MSIEIDSISQEPVYKQPKDHSELKRMVEQYLSLSQSNADLIRRDRDYYDGDQISGERRKVLADRGQPVHHNNKIRLSVDGLLGLIDQSETDPEAYPRNVVSQDAADAVTKTLRYLSDKANYERSRKVVSQSFLIEGTGAAVLEFNNKHIDVTPILWEDLIYDPLSRDHWFADAKFMGIAKLLDAADVEALYPEAYAALNQPVGDFNIFYDDERKDKWWSTARRDRLRVVDLYYEVGFDWHRAIFCDTGILYAGPCDYHDDDGNTFCPVQAVSCSIKRNGDRYGVVRDLVPLQDSLNMASSRFLHRINSRQVRQTDMYAPPANAAIARKESAKPDGVIPYGYETIDQMSVASGDIAIITQAAADMDRMTPSAAVLGRTGGSQESGRARQIMQAAGSTETARPFGRFGEFELTLYRKMWWIAREYLDQPTLIRIMDDPKAPEFLKINEPVMGPVVDPQTGQPTIGVVGMKNRLAELDMDIVLGQVKDSVTLAAEVFETLLDYAKGTGISPFDPHFSALIEMSPLPNKRETIDRLAKLGQAQQQQPDPQAVAAQQAAQQLGQQAAMAKIEKDKAHADKATAEAERTTLENHVMVAQVAQHVAENYPQA